MLHRAGPGVDAHRDTDFKKQNDQRIRGTPGQPPHSGRPIRRLSRAVSIQIYICRLHWRLPATAVSIQVCMASGRASPAKGSQSNSLSQSWSFGATVESCGILEPLSKSIKPGCERSVCRGSNRLRLSPKGRPLLERESAQAVRELQEREMAHACKTRRFVPKAAQSSLRRPPHCGEHGG